MVQARQVTRQTVRDLYAERERLEQERRDQDREEVRDRVASVLRCLAACEEELGRLEQIHTHDAEDCNALSAAKGFSGRARTSLARHFDPSSLPPEAQTPWGDGCRRDLVEGEGEPLSPSSRFSSGGRA